MKYKYRIIMHIFIISSRDPLANNPHSGRNPQVENRWFGGCSEILHLFVVAVYACLCCGVKLKYLMFKKTS